jgi:anti-sigma-K factor RskA
MAEQLSDHDLEGLLGPYALDAVDDDERVQVDRYLARDPHAAALVAEYREVAALLAQPDAEVPTAVWDRIENSCARELTASSARSLPAPRAGVRRRRRVVAAIAAAAAAAVLALGVLGGRYLGQGAPADSAALHSAAQAAARRHDATHVTLVSADGTRWARVVTVADGRGYLLESNLPRLTSGRTYQLWALVGAPGTATTISAGVLGNRPGVAAFEVRAPVVGFAITDEPAPGVASPTSPPLVQGTRS